MVGFPVHIFLVIFGILNILLTPFLIVTRAKDQNIKPEKIELMDLFSLFSMNELEYLPMFTFFGFFLISFGLYAIFLN